MRHCAPTERIAELVCFSHDWQMTPPIKSPEATAEDAVGLRLGVSARRAASRLCLSFFR